MRARGRVAGILVAVLLLFAGVSASGALSRNATASEAGTQTELKEAKLKLKVKPHVTSNGDLVMDVEVSKDSPDFVHVTPDGVPIQTRSIKTTVRMKTGKTLVIGGIYEVKSREEKCYGLVSSVGEDVGRSSDWHECGFVSKWEERPSGARRYETFFRAVVVNPWALSPWVQGLVLAVCSLQPKVCYLGTVNHPVYYRDSTFGNVLRVDSKMDANTRKAVEALFPAALFTRYIFRYDLGLPVFPVLEGFVRDQVGHKVRRGVMSFSPGFGWVTRSGPMPLPIRVACPGAGRAEAFR